MTGDLSCISKMSVLSIQSIQKLRFSFILSGLALGILFLLLLGRSHIVPSLIKRSNPFFSLAIIGGLGLATLLFFLLAARLARNKTSVKQRLPFQFLGLGAVIEGIVLVTILTAVFRLDSILERVLLSTCILILFFNLLYILFQFSTPAKQDTAEISFPIAVFGMSAAVGFFWFSGLMRILNVLGAGIGIVYLHLRTTTNKLEFGLRNFSSSRWLASTASIIALVIWWLWTYTLNPSRFLFEDDLRNLAFAVTHPPGASLLERGYLPQFYFRPFFAVQAGVYYWLFQLNIPAWRIAQWSLVLIAFVLLFFFLRRIGLSALVALLLVIAFGSSIPVIEITRWAIEGMPAMTILAILAFFLLQKLKWSFYWYLALFAIFLTGVLYSETGFAIMGATLLFGIESARTKHATLRQLGTLFAVAFAAFVIYLALRLHAVGLPNASIFEDSGYLFSSYTGYELAQINFAQRVAYHAYTIAAHLLYPFFPLFGRDDVLELRSIALWFLLACGFGIVLYLWYRAYRMTIGDSSKGHAPGWGFVTIAWAAFGAGVSTLFATKWMDQAAWLYSLQAVLSLGIIYGLVTALPKDSLDRRTAVYALGLIVTSSVITFSYFRERHHYLALLAWVVLLGLCLKYLTQNGLSRVIRYSMIGLTMMLVLFGTQRLHSVSLDPINTYALNANSMICQSFFPVAISDELAQAWNISPEQMAACRAIAVQ